MRDSYPLVDKPVKSKTPQDPTDAETEPPGRRLSRPVLIAAVVAAAVVIVLVLFGLFSSGDNGGGSAAASAAKDLQAGLSAQLAGDVDTALTYYDKVLEKDPKNTAAIYNIGVIRQQQGDLRAAENQYRLVLVINPDYPRALFNLAIIRTTPSPNEAVDLYRHVIAVEPDNAGAHLNLGFLLHDLGHDDEAQLEFAKAIELDPKLASRIPAEETSTTTESPTRTTSRP